MGPNIVHNEISSSIISAPEVFTEESQKILSKTIEEIYFFCKNTTTEILGTPQNSFYIDLSNKNITINSGNEEKKQLKKIKMTSYNANSSRIACVRWKFKFVDDTTNTYVTAPSSSVGIPTCFFNGMECELFHYHDNYKEINFDKKKWDTWEVDFKQANIAYNKHIYKQIIATMGHLFSLGSQQEMNIVDVGGGSGRLSEMLLKKFSERITKIFVVDSNEVLIKKSTERSLALKNKIIPLLTDITHANFPSEELFKNVNIVIMCGIIASQVLSKDESKELLKKVYEKLDKKSYVIITSFTESQLKAKDYERIGYKILNKSAHYRTKNQSCGLFNFYVLQK